MAVSFSSEFQGGDSILCSTKDTGTYVIPDVAGQTTASWEHAVIWLARHQLSAVQQGDALLVIRNTDLLRLDAQ